LDAIQNASPTAQVMEGKGSDILEIDLSTRDVATAAIEVDSL